MTMVSLLCRLEDGLEDEGLGERLEDEGLPEGLPEGLEVGLVEGVGAAARGSRLVRRRGGRRLRVAG